VDAEAVIQFMQSSEALKATEHVWIGTESAPAQQLERLEEALRKVNHLQHLMAIELDAIPQQPRIEFWTRQMEEVICDALGERQLAEGKNVDLE
jgi:2C-methyl-D-erythritol 2,4-cyclodiphosphate synthase